MRLIRWPRRRTLTAVGVVLALLLTGGAWYATAEVPVAEAGPHRDPGSGSRGGGPDRALELWSGFSVGAEPRPLVLFEKADRAPIFRKTTTGEEARAAFRAGALDAPSRLPASPTRAEGWR